MLKYRGAGVIRAGFIGVVVIVLIIAVGLAPERILGWATSIRYQAVFADLSGLAVGNDVTVSGMKLGKVTAVSLQDPNALVTFTVDSKTVLGSQTTAHIRTGTLLGQRNLTLESGGYDTLSPMAVIPLTRTSSPYTLTDAVGELTANTTDTDTATLNQSLDTLSATIDQIAPQLGPTFDGLSRVSEALNARNSALGELFASGRNVTEVLASHSEQVSTLILNANDLVGMLSDRRQTIVELLTYTSAISREVTGLVHDNEADLAPTLDKLNTVLAMLERQRDNIALALPRLAKYQITLGETVSSGPYYSAYIPNLDLPAILQPFLDYAFGFRRGRQCRTTTRQCGPTCRDTIPPQRDSRKTAAVTRATMTRLTAVALGILFVASAASIAVRHVFAPTTITAIFAGANAIYPGDDVRIAGVKVGTITGIEPDATQAIFTLEVAHGIRVAADAKAVVVAQNLVSARFVQLTPGGDAGPAMDDGAVIPRDRTAVPVEWDEVKEQLNRLATDLGPSREVSTSSVARFIDSAADAMDGNGEKLRQALNQLAGISRVIADGSGDITEIIGNLQTFVTVLRESNEQIVQFQDRLATLTGVLDGSRSDLDAALVNLSEAVGEVQRFVAGNRDRASEQVARLVNVTQNLVDHREDLEQVMHVAPTALANAYNMQDPRTGGASGVFVLNNLADPNAFFCGMLGALANVTAPESGKLCNQYLGPGLDTVSLNYLPFPLNPLLTPIPSDSKLIYSEPELRPGGAGSQSGFMPIAPEDSAYQPAPGASPTLPEMLLPAEGPTP